MDDRCEGCLKIGQKAPDFSVLSTFGPVSLADYKGKWLVFFSHPGDLSLVLKCKPVKRRWINGFSDINTSNFHQNYVCVREVNPPSCATRWVDFT